MGVLLTLSYYTPRFLSQPLRRIIMIGSEPGCAMEGRVGASLCILTRLPQASGFSDSHGLDKELVIHCS